MTRQSIVNDILRLAHHMRVVGAQYDVVVMSPRVYQRIKWALSPRQEKGNAHQRRCIRRRNARVKALYHSAGCKLNIYEQ